MAPPAVDVIREIRDFVTTLPHADDATARFPRVAARFPGLPAAYRGIPAVSPAHRNQAGRMVREWNPLSQRPYVPPAEPGPFAHSGGAAPHELPPYNDFERIALRFSETGHELLHVWLWEPTFHGHTSFLALDEDTFVDWAHIAEAACFWYGDCFLYARLVAHELGDSNLANKSAGFSSLFHPAQVMDEVGIRGDRAQQQAFFDLFTLDYELSQAHDHTPRWVALRDRVYKFVLRSSDAQRRYRAWMHESGAAGEFFQRFCRRPHLPRAHDAVPHDTSHEGLRAYAARVLDQLTGTAGPAAIPDHADRERIARVRHRRAVQGQAYTLMQVRHALHDGLLVDSARAPIRQCAPLERALDHLERALDHGCDPRACRAEHEQAGRLAQQALARLSSQGAFVARRRLVLPEIDLDAARAEHVGLSTHLGADATPERMRAIVSSLAVSWPRVIARHPALADALKALAGPATSAADMSVAYDEILSSPHILPSWTVRAADLDLIQGRVREPCFEMI